MAMPMKKSIISGKARPAGSRINARLSSIELLPPEQGAPKIEELRLEKEIFEEMYRKYHNNGCDEFEYADMRNKDRDIDNRGHLSFIKIAENTYKILNTNTGRFYNLELGIDEV